MLAYKYQAGTDRDIVTLQNDQIFLPTKDALNDPFEGLLDTTHFDDFIRPHGKNGDKVKMLLNELILRMDKAGIYSLSKDVFNELLWAHYANQHKGFAIEYDLETLKEEFTYGAIPLLSQIDVIYSNTPMALDASQNVSETILQTIIGVKSLVWKYENEIRLLFERPGLMDISFKAIKSIYFGLRCSESVIDKVMKSLRGRDIAYFQMVAKSNQYLLEPQSINDKYLSAPKYIPNKLSIDEYLLSEAKLGIYFRDQDLIRQAVEEIATVPNILEIYEVYLQGPVNDSTLKIFTKTYSNLTPIRSFEFCKGENDDKFQRTK